MEGKKPPAVGGPAAVALVLARQPDPVAQRLLRSGLQLQVDGQPDCVARVWRAGRLEVAERATERVDAQARRSRRPAEERVVPALDAGLSDHVAEAVALALQLLQLRGADLADVAEQVRSEIAVWVCAQVRVDD